ncbi:aspartate/glutamate racemase family protein [Pseudomonas sp. A-RE-26]|uniref:aspartate/glutamate racemase family protein n=1 Tax=Pseudomonas sp. A-RE-26 TaxID=2832402 RepID=UPI0008124E19|nr:aspartate/glutamate racemase family protein [Pseudomonas sp. A-RE-26]CRM91378.1 hypothetical protein [Pseudomonas sp. 22 E 5]
MRITCLHTAASNIAVFDTAAKTLGLGPNVVRHEVRADLLAAAEQAGSLTAEIAASTASALLALARHADAVVLTCSTLGPAVELIAPGTQVPILRADAALAVTAVQAEGKIVVLCAVKTTLAPTSELFQAAALCANASIEVQWVNGAWDRFKAGDINGYLAMVAQAADQAYEDGASLVVLAQASMSSAASQVTAGPPPLSSATAGLAAAIQAIG